MTKTTEEFRAENKAKLVAHIGRVFAARNAGGNAHMNARAMVRSTRGHLASQEKFRKILTGE